jgi:predicted amidohydrolase
MQAHSYTNATFSIAAARAGFDDGKFGLIGCSCTSLRTVYCTVPQLRFGSYCSTVGIVHPEGHILAQSQTMDDELIVAEIDLEDAKIGKQKVFNFGLHRQPHQYSIITAQAGVTPPPRLT